MYRCLLGVLGAAAVVLGVFGTPALAENLHSGAVYTMTNAPSGNEVLAYRRDHAGNLELVGAFATGGSGAPGLGNQGGLVMSGDHRFLIGVNAGTDSIFVMRIRSHGLELVATMSSGGDRPISVASHRDLLYVLNAGVPNGISGFFMSHDGILSPIPGSIKALSGPVVGPAQIGFSRHGSTLVVTEKATSMITTYIVGDDGVPSDSIANPSSGMTPFGFAFDKRGHLIVSEAFGGSPGASAVSSYEVGDDGALELISGSVLSGQTAACWVTVVRRFAYTTNTADGTLSSFAISHDGEVALEAGVAAATGVGSAPIDMAVTKSQRHIYVLNAGAHTITGYRVHDGTLTPIGAVAVPIGANGLVAR